MLFSLISTAALFAAAAAGLALPTPVSEISSRPHLMPRPEDRASVSDQDLVFMTTVEENRANAKCMLAKMKANVTPDGHLISPNLAASVKQWKSDCNAQTRALMRQNDVIARQQQQQQPAPQESRTTTVARKEEEDDDLEHATRHPNTNNNDVQPNARSMPRLRPNPNLDLTNRGTRYARNPLQSKPRTKLMIDATGHRLDAFAKADELYQRYSRFHSLMSARERVR